MRRDEFFFGPFKLAPERALLLEGEIPVRLGSRALDILTLLVERAPDTVTHQEILSQVWSNTFVDEINLRVHLNTLRKALRDGQPARYIVNTPGRGYRFAAPVDRRRPVSKSALHSSVPNSLTKLVGRSEEVQTIARELPSRRFVTITGPGGIGKTSVALEAVHQLAATYPDGIYMVDLASVSDPRMVAAAVASALQVPALFNSPLSAVLSHLGKKQVLLVLDNCEQVVETAASVAESLLRASPNISVIATSREPLRAEGEWIFRLPALASPHSLEKLDAAQALAFPAIKLFVERAECGSEPFALNDSDVPILADLCRSLDGIPLAIEFAAARVGLFGVAGLAARLDDRFTLLTRGRRTAPPRHRTLRATLDWSFNLLSASERTLLTRLSVFRAPFTKEAAVAVAACEKVPASEVLDGLTDLTAKSLATASLHGSSVVYRLLETARVYAAAKLAADYQQDEITRRHAEYFRETMSLAECGAERHLYFADEARAAIA